MRKKIVILGGGNNQMPLIERAKTLGYKVVLCDFRNNVPGIKLSEVHYQIDTMNYDAVFEVCSKEKPDGVITNSEPVMPVLNKIANKLGLVGNNEEGIDILMSKSKFRKLQQKIGVFCPKSIVVNSLDENFNDLGTWIYPIIIKPCECSGSRGSKKIEKFDSCFIQKTFNDCKSYSRNGLVVIEEFVEMPSLTTIEGDVFLYKGDILWNGLFYTKRSDWAPMVPQTYIAPLNLNNEDLQKIKSTLKSIFAASNVTFGEYNIEGYFTKTGEFFVIEINVRQGGHEIPQFVQDFSGIDLTKLLVSTCVSDLRYWEAIKSLVPCYKCVVKHTVFSPVETTYQGLYIDARIKKYVHRVVEFKKIGDKISKCVDGTSMVAIVDLFFDDIITEEKITNEISSFVYLL